jgi:glutamate--cysteine ligase
MQMSVHDQIHGQIVRNHEKVEEWFKKIRREVDIPFYSSYDVRDSGTKVANIDANIYPAGFNNICQVDRENCGPFVRTYVERHYGVQAKKILILTEEHTGNPYYWDNVAALRRMIEDAGLDVRIAFPHAHGDDSFTMQSASRGPVEVMPTIVQDGMISVKNFVPDLVISNNDFSRFYEEWGNVLKTPINPPRELGWYQRKKSTYFKHYNELCQEFARLINVDPWLLTVETELFTGFDIADEGSRNALAERVDAMIARLKVDYEKRGIKDEPFVFVKNNSGTYGLGVMRVANGAEVKELNYKTRKKMKAAKGGREVEEVIIQEGVRSIVRSDGVTAEPTLYLLGCQLAGGFLRTHAEKDETESLNSPGAVYKRLCVSDLKISVEGHPLENVYGWIAKIGVLAIGREAAEMRVHYNGYTRWTKCAGE